MLYKNNFCNLHTKITQAGWPFFKFISLFSPGNLSEEATTPPWANKNSYVRDVLRPIEQHGDYINRATFWFQISKLCHKPKNVLLFNYSHLLRIFPWYIHKFFWVKLYQKFGNSSKKTTPARRPLPNPSRRADTIGKFGH